MNTNLLYHFFFVPLYILPIATCHVLIFFFFFILNFCYFIRKVKSIYNKLWLVEYRVIHNKWYRGYVFLINSSQNNMNNWWNMIYIYIEVKYKSQISKWWKKILMFGFYCIYTALKELCQWLEMFGSHFDGSLNSHLWHISDATLPINLLKPFQPIPYTS